MQLFRLSEAETTKRQARTEPPMIRILIPLLFLILPLGACNPEGPVGPEKFSPNRVYGLWKMRMDSPGCAPAEELLMDFGPFGVTQTGDSIKVSGSWFLDVINPAPHKMGGFLFRVSGLAVFTMNDPDTKLIEGVFVSNTNFAGAYRELEECVVRLRGKFIE